MIEYYSQLGQDKFVDQFFKQKENGIFVDVGAHDGVSCSNTYFLELNRNWTGLCVEPGQREFDHMKTIRRCFLERACISNYDGESEFTYIEGYANMLSGLTEDYNTQHLSRINSEMKSYGGSLDKITIPVFRLQTLLDKYGLINIDYCSIDTEGSEFNVIKSIDYDKVNIKIFSIENNYSSLDIQEFLEERGYELHCKLQWDDIFIRK